MNLKYSFLLIIMTGRCTSIWSCILHFGLYVSFNNFYFNSTFCFSISKYFMLAKINFKMQNRNLLLKFLLKFFPKITFKGYIRNVERNLLLKWKIETKRLIYDLGWNFV